MLKWGKTVKEGLGDGGGRGGGEEKEMRDRGRRCAYTWCSM